MTTFQPIHHQFSLFDYNQMRPLRKIPLKRISKERMMQAMAEMKSGKPKNLVDILRDVNDSLDRFEKRLSNKRNGAYDQTRSH